MRRRRRTVILSQFKTIKARSGSNVHGQWDAFLSCLGGTTTSRLLRQLGSTKVFNRLLISLISLVSVFSSLSSALDSHCSAPSALKPETLNRSALCKPHLRPLHLQCAAVHSAQEGRTGLATGLSLTGPSVEYFVILPQLSNMQYHYRMNTPWHAKVILHRKSSRPLDGSSLAWRGLAHWRRFGRSILRGRRRLHHVRHPSAEAPAAAAAAAAAVINDNLTTSQANTKRISPPRKPSQARDHVPTLDLCLLRLLQLWY